MGKKENLCLIMVYLFFMSCGPEKTIGSRGARNQKSYEFQSAPFDAAKARGFKEFREKYNYDLEWLLGPNVGADQSNSLRLNFVPRNQNEQKNKNQDLMVQFFDLSIFMKIHGHGGLDRHQYIENEENSFLVGGFHFTMNGPWELNIKTVIDGVSYFFEIPVSV